MRKTLLLFSAALLFSGAAMAQTNGLQIGVKAGVNDVGWLGKDSEGDRWKNRQGPHGGIFLSIPVTPKTFSFQPELLYSMKGAKHSANLTAGNADEDVVVTQHHIDVPLMAVVRARFLVFELGVVPSVLLATSTKIDTETDNAQMYKQEVEKLTDEFNRFGFGVAGGIGIMLENGFTVGLRYNADLNRLVSKDVNPQPNYHNAWGQLSIGWLFGGRPGAELSTMGSNN